jgi:hypothetical protein
LYILDGGQFPCHSDILEGLLVDIHAEIHFGLADQVRLEWEEAVDLVHDALGIAVNHQQVINITEDIGIVPCSFLVCLLLEPQVRISEA